MTEDTADSGQAQPTGSRSSGASLYGALAIVFLLVAGIAAAGLWQRHQDILADTRDNAQKLTGILTQHMAIRIDLIEDAKRCRIKFKQGKEQRHSRQGLFTAG